MPSVCLYLYHSLHIVVGIYVLEMNKVCLTVFEADNLFLFSAWITGMEYEIKADLHPLLSSVLFCTFLYFIYLARRACLSPEGREHNFAHLWVCITILNKYFSFHHTPWLNGCPNPIVPYTTRWGALDEKKQTSGRHTTLQTICLLETYYAYMTKLQEIWSHCEMVRLCQ